MTKKTKKMKKTKKTKKTLNYLAHPLIKGSVLALDVEPPDWLKLIRPYDATGEAELKEWQVTQHVRT